MAVTWYDDSEVRIVVSRHRKKTRDDEFYEDRAERVLSLDMAEAIKRAHPTWEVEIYTEAEFRAKKSWTSSS